MNSGAANEMAITSASGRCASAMNSMEMVANSIAPRPSCSSGRRVANARRTGSGRTAAYPSTSTVMASEYPHTTCTPCRLGLMYFAAASTVAVSPLDITRNSAPVCRWRTEVMGFGQ